MTGAVAQEDVTVAALQGGFLAQHDELEFSTDGVTWAPVPAAPRGISIKGTSPLDAGGTAAFTFNDSCESAVYRVDQDGQVWERIELDLDGAGRSLLPNSGRVFLGGSGIGARSPLASALLIDDAGGPIVSSGVLEQDGLRLTRTMCWDEERFSEGFELIDIDSQRLLAAEQTGWADGSSSLPGLIEAEDAVTVLDSTGEQIASFDPDQMTWTDIGVGRLGEVWLVTTVNATDWHVDDLSDFAVHQQLFAAAARNGDTVLVGSEDEWLRYEVPGS